MRDQDHQGREEVSGARNESNMTKGGNATQDPERVKNECRNRWM